jgi:hypothetical protein
MILSPLPSVLSLRPSRQVHSRSICATRSKDFCDQRSMPDIIWAELLMHQPTECAFVSGIWIYYIPL